MGILSYMKKSHVSRPRQNLSRLAPSQREGGYTLIEVIVVVMIISALAAIAAPGWLSFVNRQRINGLGGEVYQTLQTAQSDAKKNKLSRTVLFSKSNDGLPQVSINGGPVQRLGQGQIKKGQVTDFTTFISTTTGTKITAKQTNLPITFDYQGNVTTTDYKNGSSASPPYIVTVSGSGAKRCVIVQTLLGGIRTANNKDCP